MQIEIDELKIKIKNHISINTKLQDENDALRESAKL